MTATHVTVVTIYGPSPSIHQHIRCERQETQTYNEVQYTIEISYEPQQRQESVEGRQSPSKLVFAKFETTIFPPNSHLA